MIIADFIFIGIALIALLIGLKRGFGGILDRISRGGIGALISIAIVYALIGVVYNIPFVTELLNQLTQSLSQSGSTINKILLNIRIDYIVLGLVMFIIVQIIRKLIFNLIIDIFEIDNFLFKLINKTLGIVVTLALTALIILVIASIAYLVTGAEGAVYQFLQGSKLGLDNFYLSNPLNGLFESVKGAIPIPL